MATLIEQKAARGWNKEASHVMHNTDFSDGLGPWELTSASGDSTLMSVNTPDLTFQSPGAMMLTTDTAGGAANEVHLFQAMAPAKNILWEVLWAQKDENLANMGFYLGYYDGDDWIHGALIVSMATNLYQVDLPTDPLVKNLVTMVVQDTAENSSRTYWYRMRLAIDFENERYLGVQFGNYDFTEQVEDGNILRHTPQAGVLPQQADFALETTNMPTPTPPVSSKQVFGYSRAMYW